MVHTEPQRVREQLLLCGEGISLAKVMCNIGGILAFWPWRAHPLLDDDFLWLPLVACRYIKVTGDIEVLR